LEAPALVLSAPQALATAWAQYTQTAGGLVLWPDGTVSARDLAPGVPLTHDVDLAVWVFSTALLGSTAHSISSYQGALSARISGGGLAAVGPTVGSFTLASAGAVMLSAGGALGAPTTSNLDKEGGNAMAGYIPPLYRATAHNMGANEWHVAWMGNLIATGSSKSNAKTLAKYLNSFLRRLQVVAEVDHGQFLDSATKYFAVASEAALGFSPPMNVV
jgi:hypothetical protein